MLNPSTKTDGLLSTEDTNKNAFTAAHSYLYLYFTDKTGFVDRQGTKYSAPAFSGSIANPEITAVVGIVLEAVYDNLLDTPVWTDAKTNAVTTSGAMPTAFTLGYATNEVLASGTNHISQDKLKVMNYLSQLAGTQSKTVAGMVIRLFGKFNLDLVLGAGFSFGDNQTLAQVIDEIFQSSAQRLSMEVEIPIFRLIDDSSSPVRSSDPANEPANGAASMMNQLGKPRVP